MVVSFTRRWLGSQREGDVRVRMTIKEKQKGLLIREREGNKYREESKGKYNTRYLSRNVKHGAS